MALTDAQMADVRRFAGYPLVGTTITVSGNQDIAYQPFGLSVMSLYTRLTTLSASEETVLTTVYLPNLTSLETALIGAGANLDTAAASVWTHNKNEVGDRTGLFNQVRRAMCAFLGLPPGPGLGNGGLSVARC